jgi:uncharacterized protein YbaP (TraB family)
MFSAMMKLFCLCLLLFPLLVPGQKDNEKIKSLLWEIKGKGLAKPSYLFGTFHLMCKDEILFSNKLKQKLGAADEVYFEVDLDDPAMMTEAFSILNMKNGKQLKDYLTEAEYKKLDSVLKNGSKVSLSFFNHTKPYLISSLLYTRFMKCNEQSGVEMELMKLAKKENKIISGLETLSYQASIFDSIPYEKQAKELMKLVDSLDKTGAEFYRMEELYRQQDLEAIAKMLNESDFEAGDNKNLLLVNRNKNWVEQLKKRMPSKSLFIAVGAGHLPGNDGVIELLRKEGYSVKPVQD